MLIELYPGVWRNVKLPTMGASEIPFIRVFPSGEKRLQTLERPQDIYLKACKFIAHGGRYLVSILIKPNNVEVEAEVIAAMPMNEVLDDNGVVRQEQHVREVASEKCPHDGPELLAAIDRIIEKSVARLDEVQ